MLPKKKRLSARILKEIFLTQKPVFNNKNYKIFIRRNVYTYPRISIIVPKNVDKRSVIRNKIKRKFSALLEMFEKQKTLLPRDYVIIIKQNILYKKIDELKSEFIKILNEISN